MALYDFAGQSINPKKVCKITPVLTKKVNNKTKYYFKVHLSGNIIDSLLYNTESQVDSERTSLLSLITSC